jgi:uncharacterized RDD family membrane protein YckC
MNEQPVVPSSNEPQAISPDMATEPETSAAPLAPSFPSVGNAWIIRALAYLGDSVVLTVAGALIGSAALALSTRALEAAGMAREITGTQDNPVIAWLFGFLIMTAYFVIFEWQYGATPGKMLLLKRVIQADGSPCRFGSALVRALARLVDGILFGLVAFQEMKKGALQQRLGDRAGHTLVVSAGDPFIRRARPLYRLAIAALLFLIFDLAALAGLQALSWRVVPRDQLYAQLPVADLNLKEADLGEAFELKADSPLKVSSGIVREANERLFVAAASAVKVRVFVYKVYLTDTDSDLAELGQTWTKTEIDTAQGFKPLTKPRCGDRASSQTFSNTGDDQQGYVLEIVKRNVLVSVISFGQATAVTEFKTNLWGCTIAARIR